MPGPGGAETEIVDVVGPQKAVRVFGIKLVGFTAESGRKLLLSFVLVFVFWLLSQGLRRLVRAVFRGRTDPGSVFWSSQAVRILLSILFLLMFVSIWFDDPTRLATGLGLVTAGLAFALQKVVTAMAGYVIILRGKLFNVGDRVSIGGVRGDVIGLEFTRTTVMEMGQPPSVQMADPAMWVEARQYTGRIVTITNDKIFETPVYNYSREFPFIWEELRVVIPYGTDRAEAERVILEAARRHAVQPSELSEDILREMQRRYFIETADLAPRVFLRLTDNWLELTVRFVARAYRIRDLKDAMSREILTGLEAAGIPVASATVELVKLPDLRVRLDAGGGQDRP